MKMGHARQKGQVRAKTTKKTAKKPVKKEVKKVSAKKLTRNVCKKKVLKKSKKLVKPVGKKRGRPKTKRPTKKDAEKIDDHDDFYHPPEKQPTIQALELLGYCMCGAMIVSTDKIGHRYQCMNCGTLCLRSKLLKEKPYARNDVDDDLDTDDQSHHDEARRIIYKHQTISKKRVDEENPHGEMLK